MEKKQWERIQELFSRLLPLDPEERQRILAFECEGDLKLRELLERMLVEAAHEDDFLNSPLSAPEDRPPPKVLGDYELLEELGRGGMGVVYRARQIGLRREVAIKVLPHGWCQSQRTILRFHREARALARLKHPGIVTIFSDGSADDLHYFAMELVDGPNLGELINARRALAAGDAPPELREQAEALDDPLHVANLLAGVAEALQAVHEAGIVHRDIKPTNLFLTADEQLKLGDFGLVLDVHDESVSLSGEFGGSPFHMSPEQASGDVHLVDARSDIYSLGVVLFELLTHERPFGGKNAVEIIGNVARGDAPTVKATRRGVHPDLATICEVAMTKDPSGRYATAGSLALDLRRVIAGEPIQARGVRRRTRAARWIKRRGALVMTGAALLLSVGLAIAVAVLSGPKTIPWPIESLALLDDARAQYDIGLRTIDLATTTFGPEVPLGRNLDDIRTAPGHYCLTVRTKGFAPMEFVRLVQPGRPVQPLRLSPQRWATLEKDMKLIRPGSVTYPRNHPNDPPIYGRELTISAYWLDQYEVSNAEYREFVEVYPKYAPLLWSLDTYDEAWDDLPVVCVPPAFAAAYAEWRGKRLPTLAELLYAGRGPKGRLFPWTEDKTISSYRGNCEAIHSVTKTDNGLVAGMLETYRANAHAVRSHPDAQSEFGIFNLFGNVRELTCCPEVSLLPDGELIVSVDRSWVAGGSWFAADNQHTLENNISYEDHRPMEASPMTGFRCAVGAN